MEQDLYSPASFSSIFERSMSGMDVLMPQSAAQQPHGKRRLDSEMEMGTDGNHTTACLVARYVDTKSLLDKLSVMLVRISL